jgi:hypothetical protein
LKYPLTIALFFFQIATGFTQLGSWNILNLRYAANKRLTFFGEGQIRSLRFYDDFHYYEVKGGASWRLNDQILVTGGGGRYDTYMELGMRNTLGKLAFEHRYRAEQRFTTRGYRNRFRYRLGVARPLVSLKKSKADLFASVWDELFLTNKAPYFERNRFYAGLILRRGSYAWNAGWLRQFDYRLTDETGRSFFQIGWQITLSKKEKLQDTPGLEEN